MKRIIRKKLRYVCIIRIFLGKYLFLTEMFPLFRCISKDKPIRHRQEKLSVYRLITIIEVSYVVLEQGIKAKTDSSGE